MPEGALENCSTCGFNRRNEGQWKSAEPSISEPGYCTIRNLTIPHPEATYCKNWDSRKPTAEGPVFSVIDRNGRLRAPWIGSTAPTSGIRTHCIACGADSQDGIAILVGKERFEFCGEPHYAEWRRLRLTGQMRSFAQFGENAYSEMYETRSPSGSYSDAKDCFREAASLAAELELAEEEQTYRARLEHIKSVFRSQF